MIVAINSPLKLSLFKQKLVEENNKVGYLKRAKFTHMFIGHQSYQVRYKGNTVKLIERKKIIGKRVWDLIKVGEGTKKNIGSLKMLSSTKDTLSKFHTEFQLKINGNLFSINKPMMKRNYCELLNDENEKVAIHLKQNLLKLKRYIQLKSSSYSTLENAVFIVTLAIITSVA